MTKSIYFFLICCFYLAASGQDFAQDIQKINTAYQTQESLVIKSTYQWFDDVEAKEPIEILEGFAQKTKEAHYAKLGPVETFVNSEYAISINHDEAIVLLQQAPDEVAVTPLNIPLDSLLPLMASAHFEKQGNLYMYEIKIKPGFVDSFDKMRITFDPKTYLINQIILFPVSDLSTPTKQTRLEIKLQYPSKSSLSEPRYSLQHFIKKQGDSWKLTPTLASYRFRNSLPKN